MKKLLSYKINNIKVSLIPTYNTNDLDGNKPYILIEDDGIIPFNYEDDNNVIMLDRKSDMFIDYKNYHDNLKNLNTVLGWPSFTNDERDILVENYAHINPTNAVIHLMTTKGWSQNQSMGYILERWQVHNRKFVETCSYRFSYVKKCVLTFLNMVDATDLLEKVKPLIDNYVNEGLLGINYGDMTDGLMDYVESTNDFVGLGLAENTYVLNFGTYQNFIDELKKIIVYGDYIRVV